MHPVPFLSTSLFYHSVFLCGSLPLASLVFFSFPFLCSRFFTLVLVCPSIPWFPFFVYLPAFHFCLFPLFCHSFFFLNLILNDGHCRSQRLCKQQRGRDHVVHTQEQTSAHLFLNLPVSVYFCFNFPFSSSLISSLTSMARNQLLTT